MVKVSLQPSYTWRYMSLTPLTEAGPLKSAQTGKQAGNVDRAHGRKPGTDTGSER